MNRCSQEGSGECKEKRNSGRGKDFTGLFSPDKMGLFQRLLYNQLRFKDIGSMGARDESAIIVENTANESNTFTGIKQSILTTLR